MDSILLIYHVSIPHEPLIYLHGGVRNSTDMETST